MADRPRFEVVWTPPRFGWDTQGPVRYAEVVQDDVVIAYVWVSADETAAGVVPRRRAGVAGDNAYVRWQARLAWACGEAIKPLAALRQWVGAPEESDAGYIPAGSEREAPGLAALRRFAGE
jgi:hypothetical protein